VRRGARGGRLFDRSPRAGSRARQDASADLRDNATTHQLVR
jgi:hypothetical protein